ncbi:MAG: hypothetical protein GC178_00815 [Flavobacteriales bacterium]|nr:hypothetical protein [Flavobacteriales bacterium]
MKAIFRYLILIVPITAIVSCNSSEPDLVAPIVGTYVGVMKISNPSFQNTSFTVVITDVTSEVVRISPSDGHGTAWTANMNNVAGVFTCISCVAQNQITFTKVNGVYNLAYNYGSNEQFSGQKQ